MKAYLKTAMSVEKNWPKNLMKEQVQLKVEARYGLSLPNYNSNNLFCWAILMNFISLSFFKY